jgi:hypothetical protein
MKLKMKVSQKISLQALQNKNLLNSINELDSYIFLSKKLEFNRGFFTTGKYKVFFS